jgi:hypothetical protein
MTISSGNYYVPKTEYITGYIAPDANRCQPPPSDAATHPFTPKEKRRA